MADSPNTTNLPGGRLAVTPILGLAALLALTIPVHADYFMSIKFASGKLAYGILDTEKLCLEEVRRHALAYGKMLAWSCKKVGPGDVIQLEPGLGTFRMYDRPIDMDELD
jgi:hypothetical protein